MVAASVQHLIESLPKAELHVHIEGCIEVPDRSLKRLLWSSQARRRAVSLSILCLRSNISARWVMAGVSSPQRCAAASVAGA